MRFIRHHAIIVTSGDHEGHALREQAHELARGATLNEDFGTAPAVSPIVASPVNGYRSFCVFPDGSKEGWLDSKSGDAIRDRLIALLRSTLYDNGSGPLDWVEVRYGGDDEDAAVTRHGDGHRADG